MIAVICLVVIVVVIVPLMCALKIAHEETVKEELNLIDSIKKVEKWELNAISAMRS